MDGLEQDVVFDPPQRWLFFIPGGGERGFFREGDALIERRYTSGDSRQEHDKGGCEDDEGKHSRYHAERQPSPLSASRQAGV